MTSSASVRSNDKRLLLSSGLHASAERTPHKPALICEDAVRTYGVLSHRVRGVCGAAIASGIVHGDRIALLAPNCIEYPEIVAGFADAGAIVATLNPRTTAQEVVAACNDCGARRLLVHESLAGLMHNAVFASVESVSIVGSPDYEKWLDAAPRLPAIAALDESDPFTLVYSSGTTGLAKGIVISHRSRALTFHAMAMEYGVYGPDDLQLGIAPMAHGAGFAFIMATLYFGGTVEILPKFDPDLVLDKLSKNPFTGVFMVPTHFQALFALPAPVLARYRDVPRQLKTIISNAAALPQATKQKIIEFFGEGLLHETYGSTEAGVVTNLRPAHQLSHPHSVGPTFGLNRVCLLDDSGNLVARGEVGELYSSSPYLFNGYWSGGSDQEGAVLDGWVTAGDLARQDQDGFYYIVDRKKDMVVSGGINVYPREIETVLQQHGAILEAAVIGVPDEYFGESLRAYIVTRAGMNVDDAELDALCRAALPGYKVPKSFAFIGGLPRNAGGKVLKKELRGQR
jgi:acyl-CoA synthetase (AMP-forming)/AMP-acid ligase II